MARTATLLALLAALLLPAVPARGEPLPDAATAVGQNAARTRFLGGGTLGRPPLTVAWTATLGSGVRSPLVVGNRAFVTFTEPGASGSTVAALDTATGARVWAHTYGGATKLGYEDGRLAVLTSTGIVSALDAATGATQWSTPLSEPFDFATSPAVGDGLVHVGLAWSGGAHTALRMSDGSIAWRRSFYYAGAPALAAGLAIHSDGCRTTAWVAGDGAQAWDASAGCTSYDGTTASDGGHVLLGGQTFNNDGGVLDIASGKLLDTPPMSSAGALAGDTMVHANGTRLEARSLTTGVQLWSVPTPGSEYNSAMGDPLVVDGVVYMVRGGSTLLGFDLDTGATVWSAPVAADTYSYYPETSLAAGSGLLLVAAGGKLVAYHSAAPSPGAGLRVVSGPEGPVRATSATFAFTGTPGTTECRLDDAVWLPCAGSVSYPVLADGPHTFSVRARVAGETVGLAARGFSVDTTAPRTTITAGPSGRTRNTWATFSFSVNGSASTTRCRLDEQPWKDCSGSADYSSVGDGEHVFSVRSSDFVGNVEEPVQRRFTVDNSGPEFTIDAQPAPRTNDPDARVAFRLSEPGTVTCSWDGASAASCASPATRDDLPDGEHSLYLAAYDDLGNVRYAYLHWYVDTRAPETTVTGSSLRDGTATVSFASDESAAFECRGDAQAYTGCSSPWSVSFPAGHHTVSVRAVDLAGNRDASPAVETFDVEPATATQPTSTGTEPTPTPTPLATPVPTPRGTPTPVPSTGPLTIAQRVRVAFEAPPKGYHVVMPKDDQLVSTPATLQAALLGYLRAKKGAKRVRVTVPYVAFATTRLDLRLSAGKRTVARSRMTAFTNTLAWPRLSIDRDGLRRLRHARRIVLVVKAR